MAQAKGNTPQSANAPVSARTSAPAAQRAAKRTLRPSADETRHAILLAAETLFAERGFHGVSIREIAAQAGVDAALVNYHFGGKADLLIKALVDRAEPFMVEREAALANCIAAGHGTPSIRAVIEAYTAPYLQRATSDDPGWKTWFKLLAKVNTSPEWAPGVFNDHFDPFIRKFIDALRQAAPGAADDKYYWCYHFFAGALVLTFAENGRVDSLSQGACQSSALHRAYAHMVEFVVAGCEAVLAPP